MDGNKGTGLTENANGTADDGMEEIEKEGEE